MQFVTRRKEVEARRWTANNVDLFRYWFDKLNAGKCKINSSQHLLVETLNGQMQWVPLGHWVVKIPGQLYVTIMPSEAFIAQYEPSPDHSRLGPFTKVGLGLDTWLSNRR